MQVILARQSDQDQRRYYLHIRRRRDGPKASQSIPAIFSRRSFEATREFFLSGSSSPVPTSPIGSSLRGDAGPARARAMRLVGRLLSSAEVLSPCQIPQRPRGLRDPIGARGFQGMVLARSRRAGSRDHDHLGGDHEQSSMQHHEVVCIPDCGIVPSGIPVKSILCLTRIVQDLLVS